MARRAVTTIDLSGPFFERDPRKTFRENIRVMMAAVAEEGEKDVKAQLLVGQSSRFPLGGGIRPGRVSAHVIGRTKNLRGKPWEVTAVVSVNNRGWTTEQGIKLMAAASYLEGTIHAFRKTKNRVRRGSSVNSAELLNGINSPRTRLRIRG